MKKGFVSVVTLLLALFCVNAKSKEYKNEKSEELVRPPLLRMTDSGYRLIWNDNSKKVPSVKFGKIKGKKTELIPVAGKVNYKPSGYYVDLNNMESGETYSVKIKGHKKIHFKAPESENAELNFDIISDHQTYVNLTEKGFLDVKSDNPDFIVSCGDMLEDGKLRYWAENFFANIGILEGIPFAACEGNNDCGRNFFENFLALENRWFSASYGMAKFIFLDSNVSMKQGSEQYLWLEDTLQKNTAKRTIVVYHHSSYMNTIEDWNFTKSRDAEKLFEKYGVKLVLNGHEHIYNRTTPINGIVYLTLPSMSGKPSVTEENKNSGYYANFVQKFNGYGKVRMSENSLNIAILDLDKNVIDEFEIE